MLVPKKLVGSSKTSTGLAWQNFPWHQVFPPETRMFVSHNDQVETPDRTREEFEIPPLGFYGTGHCYAVSSIAKQAGSGGKHPDNDSLCGNPTQRQQPQNHQPPVLQSQQEVHFLTPARISSSPMPKV